MNGGWSGKAGGAGEPGGQESVCLQEWEELGGEGPERRAGQEGRVELEELGELEDRICLPARTGRTGVAGSAGVAGRAGRAGTCLPARTGRTGVAGRAGVAGSAGVAGRA